MRVTLNLIVLSFLVLGSCIKAQELVYVPINPSFGGSSFNASWLLSSAQAQDKLTDGSSVYSNSYTQDPLADFEESIKRQILGQFSRQIISNMFGEDELKEGQYEFGDFSITISEISEGINIQIFDNSNGGESNIIIPYF